jgi:hypothetical protein
MSTLEDEIRDIAERMAKLVHEAYRRGEADALDRVVSAARAGQMQTREPTPWVSARLELVPHEDRKRAPKGTVSALVDRALNNGSGKTPDEIKACAETGYEHMVALASIRSHLRAGVSEGRYRKQSGRWFAIHERSAEEAESKLERPYTIADAQ